jgi:hypothetical protein
MEPAPRNAIILARLSDLRDDNERAPPARSPRAMTMPAARTVRMITTRASAAATATAVTNSYRMPAPSAPRRLEMYGAVPISTAASGLDSGRQAVVFAAELVSQGAAMLCCPSCCAD